jgi:hypothetical protein
LSQPGRESNPQIDLKLLKYLIVSSVGNYSNYTTDASLFACRSDTNRRGKHSILNEFPETIGALFFQLISTFAIAQKLSRVLIFGPRPQRLNLTDELTTR